MGRVKVTIIGADKFAREQIKFFRNLSDRQLREIALETERTIKQKITQSIRRTNSTGNLADSFFAQKIPEGYGVGNIAFLNQQASYWRHVNFGSARIGASHSHRVPQGSFNPGNNPPIDNAAGQRWIVGAGNFSFIPTKPIAPLNYISKTLQDIPGIISTVLSKG